MSLYLYLMPNTLSAEKEAVLFLKTLLFILPHQLTCSG